MPEGLPAPILDSPEISRQSPPVIARRSRSSVGGNKGRAFLQLCLGSGSAPVELDAVPVLSV